MRRRDILRRIDGHLERGNELMELNREASERNRQTHEDLRRFIEEITIRNERVHRGVMEGLTRVNERLVELGRETRAQTQAIFRVLDRLPPGPGNRGPESDPA